MSKYPMFCRVRESVEKPFPPSSPGKWAPIVHVLDQVELWSTTNGGAPGALLNVPGARYVSNRLTTPLPSPLTMSGRPPPVTSISLLSPNSSPVELEYPPPKWG